jgi:dolichol-phosphate mannosyltransferase
MNKLRKKLAVIIPVYNEEDSIEKVVNDWKKILPPKLFDLVFVNDGSSDHTKSILLKCKKKIKNLIVINKINEGHGKAVCDGYNFAIKKKYKYIFQTDSDNQFFASDFKKLWNKKNDFNYDIILGNRFKRNDPFIRVFLSKFVLRLFLKILFNKNVIDPNIPYRLIRTSFMSEFIKLKPQSFIAPNIIMTLHAKKVIFVRVKHSKRSYGEIQWPLKKLINFGIILLKDLKRYYLSI